MEGIRKLRPAVLAGSAALILAGLVIGSGLGLLVAVAGLGLGYAALST